MMARKQEPTAQIEAKRLPTLKTRSVTGHEEEESRPVRS
jgi:hypothetical protein